VCTLSWLPRASGYTLAFNRDERRTRAPAHSPSVRTLEGVAVLCPTDGEAGGTWITVNAAGHTVALLNRWDDAPEDPTAAGSAADAWVSRGLLVLALAPRRDADQVAVALAALALPRYRPFTLASVAPDDTPQVFEWNGRRLERSAAVAPNGGLIRTSSGFSQAEADRIRGALFREAAAAPGGLTTDSLITLHRSHVPDRGPYSICMHRPEAATVSSTVVTVTAAEARMRYLAGPPCEDPPAFELALARTAGARG
jgi:hypothetical protein